MPFKEKTHLKSKGWAVGPGKARRKRQRGDYDLKHSQVLKEIIIYFKRKMKTYQDNIEIQTTLEVYLLNKFVIKNHPISCMSRLTTIIQERIRQ